SLFIEPLDSSLMEAHLSALRLLFYSRFRPPAFGGEESLLKSLEEFCSTTSLKESRKSSNIFGGGGGVNGRRGFLLNSNSLLGGGGNEHQVSCEENERNRRALLLHGVKELALESVKSCSVTEAANPFLDLGQDPSSNPLRLRNWTKQDNQACQVFIRLVKPSVVKFRGALRVR
ncbi:hypothetical protein IE53DRAFT_364975, partial [Violaceomyces palustris]